uniref:WD40 domain-containing protein n=1 Tax=Pristionchus pacificus TaxID=54126 RepID=A0A2A6CSJ0_PRIPA|eukprot:PDM81155.1 WD40 domain-containing protein [Pristionchus pacificus]
MSLLTKKVLPEEGENEGDASSDDIADSTEVSEDEEDEDGSSIARMFGRKKRTKEAAILAKFQQSLELLVEGKKEKAKKKLRKILKQPAVSKYKVTEFLWEKRPVDNSHLSKMGRVFVAAHKNLATLDEENAIDHYLQVVGLAPRNDESWFSLGQKLVQKGDLNMAIFAFEQTNNLRADEALMSTHFLKKNYKTSLQLVAEREAQWGRFKKGEFLKKRIAAISPELKEYIHKLFGKTSFEVDLKYEQQTLSRISALEAKIKQCFDESKEKEMKKEQGMAPIKISFSDDQNAWDIMTAFCDLFDRIRAYSQVFTQRIFIEEWECRDDKLIVESIVEDMKEEVLIVEDVVEKMLDKLSSEEDQSKPMVSEGGRKRKAVEGRFISKRGKKEGEKEGMRGGDESTCDEDERPTSVDSIALREPTALEDVATYYLDARPIRPLREGISQAPSRMSATPGPIGSEEDLLTVMKEYLYEERYLTVFKALELSLYCTLRMDCLPSRSSHQSEVYRRWTLCSKELVQSHHRSIHALMVMYDEPTAMEYCMRMVHSTIDQSDDSKVMKFPEKRDLIRFTHKRVETIMDNEEELMKCLKFMTETIKEEEAFNVVGGIVSRDSIREIMEKKERTSRIHSLHHLNETENWTEIVSIIESDSQWSSVDDDDELSVRTRFYSKALIQLGRTEKAAEILNRMLFLLLSLPTLPASTIEPWIKLLNSIKYTSIPSNSKILPSLGYSLLRLTEHSHLAKNWLLWRLLHQVIKRIEESKPDLLGTLLNESLSHDDYDKSDDYNEFPTRSLRFLVHAHDKLSSNGGCGQDNGAFLKYSLSQFRGVMEKESVREILRYRKLQWLMNNVQEEIYQLLHCTFGRYSKRRRAAEDHQSGVELGEENRKIVKCAIALSIPNPIPEYNDKGTTGVDLIDLVKNRFPSFIKMSEKRLKAVKRLKKWVERGPPSKGNCDDEKTRSPLLEWPHKGGSKLESIVFYLHSLSYHRQSKNDEARQFAEYFLSSNHVRSFGEEVTKGAWIILSYATSERLFKLYDDDLLHELHHHLRPFRVASLLSSTDDATVSFLLACALYQSECASLFEKVLEIAPSMQEQNRGDAWDFQWISYFFLAKLYLKKGKSMDEEEESEEKREERGMYVVKAMDGFFEAACALQMGGTQYSQKIAVKNQKNVEPVEVHYQAYSTVWKYITRTVNPSWEVLVRLRSYTDAFSRHGVVKPSAAMDLYEMEPAISAVVVNLSFKASRYSEETDEEFVLNETKDKMELIEELKTTCKEAFKLVADRFPHRKAFHRLAQIAFNENDMQGAHDLIFKKIFPRRKKDEDLFESVVEFTSADIERSDSLSFHVSRSLRLGLALSIKLGDASSIMGVCTSLARTITDKEEVYVLKSCYLSTVKLATRSLSRVLSLHPSQWTKSVKAEILALHKSLIDVKDNIPLAYMRKEVREEMDKHGGVTRLEFEVAMTEKKPQQQRKRKADNVGSTDRILGNLGLVGRPPLPKKNNALPLSRQPQLNPFLKKNPTSPLSRPPTLQPIRPPNQLLYQPMMSAMKSLQSTLQSSPIRTPYSSLPSSSISPISDPNALIQMLIQQAQSRSNQNTSNLFANLAKKYDPSMDCFVGAATGALKSISLRDSSFSNITTVTELDPKKDEITSMAFSGEDQTEILIAQLDRSLRLYDSLTGAFSTLFALEGEGRIRGLHVTKSQEILTASEKGTVELWEKNGDKKASVTVGDGNLLTMEVNDEGKIAVSGKNILLRTLDPASLKETWKSKNVRNDWLDLEVPIWDMQARYLKDGNTIVTSTGTHEIRTYDPRVQKKPVKRMEWLEEPITALTVSQTSDWTVIAGNTKGEMAQFDLRKMLPNAKFKGQAGSVRCIQSHSSAPLIASCGIDRFVRVHDVNTRKLVHKVYCKARLNTLLLRDELSILTKLKEEDKEDWELMESKKEEELVDEKEIKIEPEDDEDVWDAIEKDGEENDDVVEVKEEDDDSEDDEDEEEEEPIVKRRKITEKSKSKGKGKERKRKESEGEKNDEIEEIPVKRKKVVTNKRKGADECAKENKKKRRK